MGEGRTLYVKATTACRAMLRAESGDAVKWLHEAGTRGRLSERDRREENRGKWQPGASKDRPPKQIRMMKDATKKR